MSDFGRYGGTDYQDRERRWRDTNRGRGGFFSSESEDRGFPGAGEDRPSRFFSSDRDDVRGGGRDRERERERSFRDNRPQDYHDLERAPSFGRDDEPRFSREYGRRVHSWYGLDY